jgi:ribonucleoside-diphosphate reductase alpha chain
MKTKAMSVKNNQSDNTDKLRPEVHTKGYTDEEAFRYSREYFKGDDLAARVWINKYALKDSEGNLFELTPDDMHHRIAREIARIEKKYPNPIGEEDIYQLMKEFKYIVPQGGPMSGIGMIINWYPSPIVLSLATIPALIPMER